IEVGEFASSHSYKMTTIPYLLMKFVISAGRVDDRRYVDSLHNNINGLFDDQPLIVFQYLHGRIGRGKQGNHMTRKERARWALINSLATHIADRAELDKQIQAHVEALAKLNGVKS